MKKRFQWRRGWAALLVLTLVLPLGTTLGQQSRQKFGVRPSQRNASPYRMPSMRDIQRLEAAAVNQQNASTGQTPSAVIEGDDPPGQLAPLEASRLRKRLPAAVGDLPRVRLNSDRGEDILPVVGHYANSEGTRKVKITLCDVDGGVPGVSEADIELARGMDVNHQNSDGHLRTRTIGGFRALERLHRPSQTGEITLIAGKRVGVHVVGTGVSMSTVEAATTSLNLSALAAIDR